MRIHFDIDTTETLSESDKVVLLALAGEISLGEPRERPDYPQAVAHTPEQAPRETLSEAIDRAHEEHDAAEAALPDDDGVPSVEEVAEEPKAKKPVNVSDTSLEKYDFHRTEGGEIVCNHCDYVSGTGRALHLHAGTHSESGAPAPANLKPVPTPKEPEAGVDAVLSTEPDAQDIADAEKAAMGDPDPEPVAEVPEPPKAADPKALRDQVAKVATEMVAAQKQAEIREVLNDVLGGVARVSMIEEKDLQKFLDAEPIAAFIASKKG